jgi:type II secretory pathway component GspD/PulD (secretin)
LASILLVTTVLSEVALSQANKTDKQKIVRQVAQKWIQVGVEQYKRGFYKAAEQSFLRAQDYEEYLAAGERERLSRLLEETHVASLERRRILGHIQTADELEKQGELIKAKTHLEKIKDSEFLTEEERKLIRGGLKEIETKLAEQKRQITEVYDRSVEFYRASQFEEAREGFIEAAKSGLLSTSEAERVEDYLVKIDDALAQRVKPSPPIEAEAEKKLAEPPAAAVGQVKADKEALGAIEEELLGFEVEPSVRDTEAEVVEELKKPSEPAEIDVVERKAPEELPVKGSYIEVVNRRRNILRGHTRAVVNDAVAKAQDYISQGEFDKAKEAVETAERAVNENQLHLGDDLFKQYRSDLKQLTEKIVRGRSEKARQLQKQKRLEAIEAQRRYREQVEADRSKRISELTDSAMAYQKQQKYPEALGQLEYLLKMDPLNNHALILRQTLEDTISFRKQLELQKESSKGRLDVLLEVDKSLIPYAEELTYPKNWREIAAKRKPDEAIGQDPADVAVYKQLDEIVDLSELTSEMPLSEAIEELKNSVEPALSIVVLWRDLYDNADIDRTTPINMDAISAVRLGTALELLLRSVSGGLADLGYAVENGVITIATVESLPSKLETLVYDVTDLLGRPADFYAISGGDISVTGGEDTAGGEGFEEEDDIDSDELEEDTTVRASNLVLLIQETVEPDSWYDVGGEGSITIYENKKLIVHQTREIHEEIEKLLKEMRKSLGHQVSIEARFLLVGENFLEDIGLDVDFRYNAGGRWGIINFQQSSASSTLPTTTAIPGSLGGADEFGVPFNLGATISGGYGNLLLNDLEVSFLLRATQAHRDATSLTAPKVSVLSGESATMRVQRVTRYARDVEVDIEEIGQEGAFRWTVDYEQGSIVSGTLLNITPTITHDKRNVLLNIVAELRDFLGFVDNPIQLPILGGLGAVGGESYSIPLPETEISRVETRVSVPDGGTLLIGGQKLSAEVERETGVPVLSKIPLIGRLFSNRSKIKDDKILLILVKPTIILQEEMEAKAIAAVEGDF